MTRHAASAQQLGLHLNPEPPRAERAAALRAFHTRSQPMPIDEALAGETAARRQQALVLRVFRRAGANERLTPRQVHAALEKELGARAPMLTSVRARMTTMSTADAELWPGGPPLQHHPRDRRPGPAGKTEGTWSLSSGPKS